MEKQIIPVPRIKLSKDLMKLKVIADKYYRSQTWLWPESIWENNILISLTEIDNESIRAYENIICTGLKI